MSKNIYQRHAIYNELFIDQEYRRKGDGRNREFWFAMDDLHNQYPECSILVERYVIKHFSTGLGEDIRITCGLPEVQKLAERIYNTHYYVVPLNLAPLEDGTRDDAIAYLVGNNS